jgi:hypothetical protein
MRKLCFIIALGLLGIAAQQTSAQSSTTYSYKYISQQPAYTAAVNTPITINLYLQETNSDQSTNSLLVNEHGLTGAGIQVAFLSGNSSATFTAASVNGGAVPTGFDADANAATFTTTSATISESTNSEPFGNDLVGVAAGAQTAGVSKVFLGSVTITTGSVGGVTSTFQITTSEPLTGDTFTNDNGYNLDNAASLTNPPGAASLYSNAQPTTFTVTTNAVPEPATAAGVVVLLSLARRRKGEI